MLPLWDHAREGACGECARGVHAWARRPRNRGLVERGPHRGPGAVAWLPRGRSWSGTAVGVVRRKEKEWPHAHSGTSGAGGQLRPADSSGSPVAGDLLLTLPLPPDNVLT